MTQSTKTDLENIWEYIQQTDPEAALIFIHTLEKHISSLEQFPFRCQQIPVKTRQSDC
ncbi:type II toxin-antitoxin system RelE/ParE family toxin [Methanospirillum stamsii]|uniref:Type II toxin-antitoxin system RelE/ParE family toxin n=1 Tax=Methanospirillum stamsii TaxID=1277351 RepID=A0A2V2NC43_9EURY|nr:type II toxin-antitoxin system RelE/ParE family toxin [Methanospirillum stamsii]PWR76330.1 hypothetical protein DLD82_00540 [Methanospirillum stamsii]